MSSLSFADRVYSCTLVGLKLNGGAQPYSLIFLPSAGVTACATTLCSKQFLYFLFLSNLLTKAVICSGHSNYTYSFELLKYFPVIVFLFWWWNIHHIKGTEWVLSGSRHNQLLLFEGLKVQWTVGDREGTTTGERQSLDRKFLHPTVF